MIKQMLIIVSLIFILTSIDVENERSASEATGLKAGTKAPIFNAIDADSNLFSLEKELKNGPIVIIFYRGFWCPVCNKHLASIQDSLKLIEKRGARVIAISPEKPDYLNEMSEKTGAEFTLLYDEGYKIADAYDVTFNPSSMQLLTYNVVLGAKLKETHSDDSQRLPIPATYIVDQDGVIVWRQFDPDYKNRSTVKTILDALNTISN